jgi:hypothetical protein
VVLNSLHELLELPAQSDRLSPENQLVQLLTVLRVYPQTGVHVLVDEDVIKNDKIRKGAIPAVVLENRRRRSAAAFEHDVWRIQSGEAPSFGDWERIASGEEPQYRRERRFSSAVL